MSFVIFEILFFGVLLAGDLVSKHFIMPFLENQPNFSYTLIDKVLTLRYSINDGAGFGFLSGKKTALIVITVIAMVAILVFTILLHAKNTHKKKSGRFLLSTLIMILAGGIGNLVDRIALGSVRDFIDYTIVETIFKRSFAICNLADVWLTLGMIFLIVYVLLFFKESKPEVPLIPDDEMSEDPVKDALEMYDKAQK